MNLWYNVWKGDTFLQTNFDQQSLVILPFCTGSQWNLVSEKLTALPGYQISLTSCTKWENDGVIIGKCLILEESIPLSKIKSFIIHSF